MKVVVFGATGMIGQGVLRECLLDPGVDHVLTIGRAPTGRPDPKLRDLVWTNLQDLSGIESELQGLDACFFCLGVSAVGMTEEQYSRITYDLTLSVATTLARLNPAMTFVFVSAAERRRAKPARCGRGFEDGRRTRSSSFRFAPTSSARG